MMTRTALAAAATALTTTLVIAQQTPQTPQTPPPFQRDPLPPIPAVLQNYKTVTAERLKHPADDDWLMVRRTYDGWGYSPLEKINKKNVNKLEPVW